VLFEGVDDCITLRDGCSRVAAVKDMSRFLEEFPHLGVFIGAAARKRSDAGCYNGVGRKDKKRGCNDAHKVNARPEWCRIEIVQMRTEAAARHPLQAVCSASSCEYYGSP